jgi:galactose-1-phosphate uridylyltransferase
LSSEPAEDSSSTAIEGFGIHEIIVETPDHSLSAAMLPEPQLLSLLRTAKARYDEICIDTRIAYATICKKQTVEETKFQHSQSHLVASQVIPSSVVTRLQQAGAPLLRKNRRLHFLLGAAAGAGYPKQDCSYHSALHCS